MSDPKIPGHLFHQEVPSSLLAKKVETIHSHEVQFYRDDAAFLLGLACFIEAALKVGNPVLVVATEAHRNGLLHRLLARGVDGVAAIEPGLHVPLDVDEALSTFMVNDLPDPLRFLTVFGDLLTSVTKAAKGSHLELQFVVNLQPGCGRKVRRMRRYRSSTSRTR